MVIPSATRRPTVTHTLVPPSPTACFIPNEARELAQTDVYSALFPQTDSQPAQILVADSPALHQIDIEYVGQQFSEEPDWLASFLPGISPETTSDFLRANAQPPHASDLDLPFTHQILTEEFLDNIFADDIIAGWDRFEVLFPGADGFWSLSAVGLNCSTNQALVFARHVYGAMGMTGTLYMLSQSSGAWSVEAEYLFAEA